MGVFTSKGKKNSVFNKDLIVTSVIYFLFYLHCKHKSRWLFD